MYLVIVLNLTSSHKSRKSSYAGTLVSPALPPLRFQLHTVLLPLYTVHTVNARMGVCFHILACFVLKNSRLSALKSRRSFPALPLPPSYPTPSSPTAIFAQMELCLFLHPNIWVLIHFAAKQIGKVPLGSWSQSNELSRGTTELVQHFRL